MTAYATLTWESTPALWRAYVDPEGEQGFGKTKEEALDELIEQVCEGMRESAKDAKIAELTRSLAEAVGRAERAETVFANAPTLPESDQAVAQLVHYAENLTGAAALVIDMGGHLDCSCSVRERDSGHRSDCYVPEMRVALDGLSAVLAQGYPGSGDPKAANNALPGVGNVPATFTLDRNGEFSDQAIERAELDAGFDRIMALSDEQVLAEARAEGIDVEANAARWRGFLEGFKKARARGGNYTADDDTHPREVTFANGRRVRVVGDGYLAVNTLDSQGSEEATRG